MTAWDFLNENARGIAALIFVAIVMWSTSRGSVECECDCTEAIQEGTEAIESLEAEVIELRETIALAAIKEEIANMRSEVVALRCQIHDLSEDIKGNE